jgi:hypothetical protein
MGAHPFMGLILCVGFIVIPPYQEWVGIVSECSSAVVAMTPWLCHLCNLLQMGLMAHASKYTSPWAGTGSGKWHLLRVMKITKVVENSLCAEKVPAHDE